MRHAHVRGHLDGALLRLHRPYWVVIKQDKKLAGPWPPHSKPCVLARTTLANGCSHSRWDPHPPLPPPSPNPPFLQPSYAAPHLHHLASRLTPAPNATAAWSCGRQAAWRAHLRHGRVCPHRRHRRMAPWHRLAQPRQLEGQEDSQRVGVRVLQEVSAHAGARGAVPGVGGGGGWGGQGGVGVHAAIKGSANDARGLSDPSCCWHGSGRNTARFLLQRSGAAASQPPVPALPLPTLPPTPLTCVPTARWQRGCEGGGLTGRGQVGADGAAGASGRRGRGGSAPPLEWRTKAGQAGGQPVWVLTAR